MTDKTETTQVYRVYIKASAQAIWDAITKPEWTERYAYGGRAAYDLKPGGRFSHAASAEMKSMGLPEEIIVGEVIESDPPRKLVQTWHPVWDPDSAAEPHTRLTYEIEEFQGGLCTLTIIHDVDGAPIVARMVPGQGDPAKGGGGWPWVLSDLKSLLETGKPMAA
jgi:uncharacterized protein YndB with AHSA1/START domain